MKNIPYGKQYIDKHDKKFVLDSLQNNFLTLVAEDCVGDRDLNAHRANLFDLQSKYADVVHSEQIFKLF